MSLSDDLAAFDARARARGVRFIGNVSPSVNGATAEEVDMLFVGDVKGVLRDLRRLPPAASPSPLHPSARATA